MLISPAYSNAICQLIFIEIYLQSPVPELTHSKEALCVFFALFLDQGSKFHQTFRSPDSYCKTVHLLATKY